MALSNLILTVAGVTAAVMLLRYDVKKSATTFRRNVRHIREWLEEESSTAAKTQKSESRNDRAIKEINLMMKTAERTSPKELESQNPKKGSPKEEKH